VLVLASLECAVPGLVAGREQPAHGEDIDDEGTVEGEVDVERVEVPGLPDLLED
jgi:hypothetical protein